MSSYRNANHLVIFEGSQLVAVLTSNTFIIIVDLQAGVKEVFDAYVVLESEVVVALSTFYIIVLSVVYIESAVIDFGLSTLRVV
ncbi:MAG: hypothetical protein DHS20C13_26140 [Thermodesulfobacteriota bacterium]|nr:MAG: hypothetical protein DHS20C13_26140 [Thermodesulfobacteriota bacterium]